MVLVYIMTTKYWSHGNQVLIPWQPSPDPMATKSWSHSNHYRQVLQRINIIGLPYVSFGAGLTEFHKDVFALIKDHIVEVLSDQNLHWFCIPVVRNLFCV